MSLVEQLQSVVRQRDEAIDRLTATNTLNTPEANVIMEAVHADSNKQRSVGFQFRHGAAVVQGDKLCLRCYAKLLLEDVLAGFWCWTADWHYLQLPAHLVLCCMGTSDTMSGSYLICMNTSAQPCASSLQMELSAACCLHVKQAMPTSFPTPTTQPNGVCHIWISAQLLTVGVLRVAGSTACTQARQAARHCVWRCLYLFTSVHPHYTVQLRHWLLISLRLRCLTQV